ncbi:MAG: flagellar motor stator protein MotA [Gammaproteobacteria bacterium CG22_combo_CG10-13_8_21_14_all_40_8]|nr:MAG: flagellar motor stator protein MotA [Gammaproteobacteria bacterium CG22_combo_CG10-13_8_21_14_all_40_8]
MALILGGIVVLLSVFGGYVLSHGNLLALWQPYEILIICGGALGSLIISNPFHVVGRIFVLIPKLLVGSPFSKTMYMETMGLMFELFNKIRREGLIAIEGDVDEPEESTIFKKYPLILREANVLIFICDYLRLMVVGDMTAYELDNLMDVELEGQYEELIKPAHAVAKVADSLPGFGIVAAVLGIVITMASLGGPPNELGAHVAAALVGTFLGILMAYGFVGPFAHAIEHYVEHETQFYKCLKTSIVAAVNGMPPQIAVEFGRKTIPMNVRPSFLALEQRIRMN